VIVLKEGRIRAQGAPSEIDEQRYSMLVEKHTEWPQEAKAESNSSAMGGTDSPIEQENNEEPIAKSSLGFMPYLFFAWMVTWRNAAFCVVRHHPNM
jgi:hypothetical protein